MIFVIATLEIANGHRDKCLDEFRKLVPLVLAEKGCIEYVPVIDLATDMDAQADLRENSITVIEKWASVDALKAHNAEPHMATFREAIGDILLNLRLEISEAAE